MCVLAALKSVFYHNNASHVGEAGCYSQLVPFVRVRDRWKSSYRTSLALAFLVIMLEMWICQLICT